MSSFLTDAERAAANIAVTAELAAWAKTGLGIHDPIDLVHAMNVAAAQAVRIIREAKDAA